MMRTIVLFCCCGWAWLGLSTALAEFGEKEDWSGISAGEPAPIQTYSLHADGGLIYDPLRREAEKTGQLERYRDARSRSCEIRLGDARLEFSVPENVRAYDVVPIPYAFFPGRKNPSPLAVQAVAYESGQVGDKPYFDLSLPGKIDFGVEYLGSVTGRAEPEKKQNVTRDFSDRPAARYPNLARSPLVRSGTVENGDIVWFRFRLTNTGNTIFDSEGFGGGQLYPELLKKGEDGVFRAMGRAPNAFYRLRDYWYPGQPWEVWVTFVTTAGGSYRLEPGDYKVRLRMTRRSYQNKDAAVNYWDGPVVFAWEQPIRIADQARNEPVAEGVRLDAPAAREDGRPAFIHTMEEFMTAFDCHRSTAGTEGEPIRGALYLQVAPWTSHVTVRLIAGKEGEIGAAQLPVAVDTNSLAISPSGTTVWLPSEPNRPAWPVFLSQTMADMRSNAQLSPWPEKTIRDGIRAMKAAGVNVLSTTSMPWLYDDRSRPPLNLNGDALKYALDVIRNEGLRVEGWTQYPFDRGDIREIASWISGMDYSGMETVASGYGDAAPYISMVDPLLPAAHVEVLEYHYERWGDLFFREGNGTTPISIEDTRGWMRDDIHVRFPVGTSGVKEFQSWLKRRYDSIENLNRAWGSRLASFEEIQPETGKLDEFGKKWSYADKSHLFHEWNAPLRDYDIWRTLARVQNYRDVLKGAREFLPEPRLMFRTEGGNAIVAGLNPADPNAHFRHAFYSQRRAGAIAEVLDASGVATYHCDYATVPYTPSELRVLIRSAVAQGIVPAWLPQFNEMRDVALNEAYGRDYQTPYNVNRPVKGYLIHALTASFPWYQAMIEEGGIPGILWEDFECSGFVTETQLKEMRFYQLKLRQALEGKPASSDPLPAKWLKPSRAMRSYENAEN